MSESDVCKSMSPRTEQIMPLLISIKYTSDIQYSSHRLTSPRQGDYRKALIDAPYCAAKASPRRLISAQHN